MFLSLNARIRMSLPSDQLYMYSVHELLKEWLINKPDLYSAYFLDVVYTHALFVFRYSPACRLARKRVSTPTQIFKVLTPTQIFETVRKETQEFICLVWNMECIRNINVQQNGFACSKR
jgi:hypothetical protein